VKRSFENSYVAADEIFESSNPPRGANGGLTYECHRTNTNLDLWSLCDLFWRQIPSMFQFRKTPTSGERFLLHSSSDDVFFGVILYDDASISPLSTPFGTGTQLDHVIAPASKKHRIPLYRRSQ
jgi:hypothetical protein